MWPTSLQVDKFVTVGDAAFGDVGAKLTAKHTVQLAGGQVGLALFTIAHFFEVLMSNVQKLLLGVIVTTAGYGEVELRFLNVLVALGVVDEILFEFVGGIGVDLADRTEVLHLQQFGDTLGNLALVVIDGVEGGYEDICIILYARLRFGGRCVQGNQRHRQTGMAHGDASEPRCERVDQRRSLLKGGEHHQLRGRISVFEDWSLAKSRVPECGETVLKQGLC